MHEPITTDSLFKDAVAAGPIVFMAVLGGLVKLIRAQKRINLWTAFSTHILSGFVGLMIYYATLDLDIGRGTLCFVAGVGGAFSSTLLDVFGERVEDMFRSPRASRPYYSGFDDGCGDYQNNRGRAYCPDCPKRTNDNDTDDPIPQDTDDQGD